MKIHVENYFSKTDDLFEPFIRLKQFYIYSKYIYIYKYIFIFSNLSR